VGDTVISYYRRLPANSSMTRAEPPDLRRVDAARGGDDDAFRELVEPHRRQLHAHCYRMLGSAHDADDALQDVLLRAWRGLAGFDASKPLRPWLYRIATNVCLDHIARRPARTLPLDRGVPSSPADGPGQPLTDFPWLEPYPDDALDLDDLTAPDLRYEQRESIELAFIAALQHLPASQRAVLILRDVLGFSAREAAQALDTSAASVNSALQRARRTIDERLPQRSQQETLRALGDERLRHVVERYVAAWERRDVDRMVEMLVDDARFAMPPHPGWFQGRHDIVVFVAGAGTPPLRHLLTRANGQPAIAWYILDAAGGTYRAASIEVLTLAGDLVEQITAFADAGFFPRFGLPDELPA
jgi:RNA polymerase sigma-70 factor (ECF subfamily)